MTDRNHYSFGRYLTAQRVEKGISLKQISRETRIGEDMLCLIENEDHARLPAEVFVKGFLRSYAKVVGADGDRVVRLYLENIRVSQSASKFEMELSRSRESFWRRLFLILAAFCTIVVLSVFAERYRLGDPVVDATPEVQQTALEDTTEDHPTRPDIPQADSAVSVAPDAVPIEKAPGVDTSVDDAPPNQEAEAPADTSQIMAAEQEVEAQPALQNKLRLAIVAVEKTWLKIIADTGTAKEYLLLPEERLSLEAESGFNLLIGNATGVRLTLNGEPVAVSGKKNQVVTLQLP